MLTPFEVLLVEDNPGDAYLTQKILTDALSQVNITHHETLGAALTTLYSAAYDCVLVDLHLPDCSGTGIIPTLRNHAPDTPIIIMTGQRDQALALQAIQAGAQDYLVKEEICAKVLGRAIRYAIERTRFDQRFPRMQ